jgi:hypothetical protein
MFAHADAQTPPHAFYCMLERQSHADPDKSCRTYGSYVDVASFLCDGLMTTPEKDRCYYELIREGLPARLYFDVEWEQTDEDNALAFERLKKLTDTVESEILKLNSKAELGYTVTDGSRKKGDFFKFSYHVVFTDVWFEQVDQGMKSFVQNLLIPTIDPTKEWIDVGVYTKNRVMRVIGCHKFNDATGTPLTSVCEVEPPMDAFIISVPPSASAFIYCNEDMPRLSLKRRAPAERAASRKCAATSTPTPPDGDLPMGCNMVPRVDTMSVTAPVRAAPTAPIDHSNHIPIIEEKLSQFGYRSVRIVTTTQEGFNFDYDHAHPDPLDLPERRTFHEHIEGYVVINVATNIVTVGTYSAENHRKSTRLCYYDELSAPQHWSVVYLQGKACEYGMGAVRRHIVNCLTYVNNANKGILITKTWDGEQHDYQIGDAAAAFASLKLIKLRIVPEESDVVYLEAAAEVMQKDVEKLQKKLEEPQTKDESTRLSRRLKLLQKKFDAAERSAEEQRSNFENGIPTDIPLFAVVMSVLTEITRDSIVFRPGLDASPSDFNLFTGYAVEDLLFKLPDRYPEASQPVFDHIKNVLCEGDDARYDYTLKWFAHMLQNPIEKAGTAALFQSEPGAGKTIVTMFLRSVLGPRYVLFVGDTHGLTGQFNSSHANQLLIVANELGSDGAAYREANLLKSKITDKVDYIERKGIDRQKIDSYCSIMMTANEWKAVRVDPGDRRYCVQQCSGAHIKDTAYFDVLRAAVADPKAQVEFFRQLREINLKGYHFGSNIPQTKYRTELQVGQAPAVYKYLADTFHSECFLPCERRTDTDTLFTAVKAWMVHNNESGSGYIQPSI